MSKKIDMDQMVEFRGKLLEWYYKNGRHFPWRNKSMRNYQKIVAEVLLQRTRAETIAKFFSKFIELFPSWKSISSSEIERLEEALKPVGLYRQRAKRLHVLVTEMTNLNGRVPYSYKELEKIPMMRQYIANATMSVVYSS